MKAWDLELAIPSRLACRRTTSTPCSSCSRACSPRPERRCAGAVLSPRRLPRSHRRPGRRPRTRLNPLPGHVHAPIGAAVGRVSNGRRRRAESAAGTDSASASPPPPPAAKSAAPKPPPSSGPDQAANEPAITMRWPMRSAIRSCARLRRLRARRARSQPSGRPAGRHPQSQLRSREQTDEIVKKIVEKDKAKVDAAKDKALTPEQKKLGGLGADGRDQGHRGTQSFPAEGRAKKRVVDSPETPMSKASSGS